jgi:hypothetical protein
MDSREEFYSGEIQYRDLRKLTWRFLDIKFFCVYLSVSLFKGAKLKLGLHAWIDQDLNKGHGRFVDFYDVLIPVEQIFLYFLR